MELEKIIKMLPDYDDPAWEESFDNVKCDIDFAKKKLIELNKDSDKKICGLCKKAVSQCACYGNW